MENRPENKICESCGVTFGCGAKLDGCWCTELTLTETHAEAIKAKFTDCLCPRCLAKFASTDETKTRICE
ncbi:MAG TPA: cysteine-rich CWC family protein [Pyrinomonadaceae bacterium]|nr:cysteine-rich CWC family protein [Pyrinomonadaceae bacterium]